jgi:hypothetical protein
MTGRKITSWISGIERAAAGRWTFDGTQGCDQRRKYTQVGFGEVIEESKTKIY